MTIWVESVFWRYVRFVSHICIKDFVNYKVCFAHHLRYSIRGLADWRQIPMIAFNVHVLKCVYVCERVLSVLNQLATTLVYMTDTNYER